MSLILESQPRAGRAARRARTTWLSPRLADYLTLMKPRVMSLVVFTGMVGLLIAPVHVDPAAALIAVLCIAAGAGAAGALNMWYDADIDAVMARTAARPIPAGRVRPGEACSFGLVLAGLSVTALGFLVNWLAGALLAATIIFYVVVYTMWLKRRTAQNIVIGGAAGACPPLIGWAAATGSLGIEPAVLFLIIFVWTPPHFWALALFRADDYARAGIPMLPVAAGRAATRRQILLYSLCLAPLGVMPWVLGGAHALYGLVAMWAGAALVRLALRLRREPHDRAARQLFRFSIVYLFVLFAALLLDARIAPFLPHLR
jgi:protoheme IX farnesyltransferase